MFIVQVVREKLQESLFNVEAYTQTKTTWNNSDWLAHEKATFYWSRYDTQRLTAQGANQNAPFQRGPVQLYNKYKNNIIHRSVGESDGYLPRRFARDRSKPSGQVHVHGPR